MMMWDGTVTTELIPEEQFFTKVIGLSQQEYKLLRYKVRVQNQILGAVETMSYTALLNYPKTLAQYKASMEIALHANLFIQITKYTLGLIKFFTLLVNHICNLFHGIYCRIGVTNQ